MDIPWVVCGDFNAIFSLEDKILGSHNLVDIHCANIFLNDFSLLEPPSTGRRFTWSNGQANLIWVKLDHFVVNQAWMAQFPKLSQNSLPRLGSDHVPIRLKMESHYSRPRTFLFRIGLDNLGGVPGLGASVVVGTIAGWLRGICFGQKIGISVRSHVGLGENLIWFY